MKRLALVGTLLLAGSAQAQFTADFQTNIISGVVSNWAGDYIAGSNTVFDLLRVENGGVLSNSLSAVSNSFFVFIGYERSASNNTITIDGAGSVFRSTTLVVGLNGSESQLIITNGGRVENSFDGWVGGDSSSASHSTSNNAATVTGSNSLWSVGHYLLIGNRGGSNRLSITDGGMISDKAGVVGLGYGGDTATVSGPGATWDNTIGANPFTSSHGELYVGAGTASGNTLIISNGGLVVDWRGYVGDVYGNSNNQVSVTGTGSVWWNRSLRLYDGSNSLVVSAGGTAVCSNLVVGGGSLNRCDSFITVDGGNLFVTNAAHQGVLQLDRGTVTLRSGLVVVDQIVINSACARLIRTGGVLIYDSAVLDPEASAVGDDIPNGWKQQYGLDLFDANLASTDNDGDGMSNLQEYLAGTSPTNAASGLRVTGTLIVSNDILISWATVGGYTNIVQVVSDLAGTYTNVSPNIVITGSGDTTTNYLDAGAVTNAASRYYRIRLVP